MYEAFYGLKEKPFNLTPDPRFLYLSEKHKEAFAHLLFGIKHRCGFIMVTGEIGTGKTTICRTLLNQLDENTEVAFIFNPCLSPEELLRTINEDFGIDSRADTVKNLIDELNQYLLDRNARGKNCVLVIDEAQDLQPGVLEQIRLLSNLETETQKLLQIVLIGQPELMQTLALPELRQLNQRITARYHLTPLDEEETLQYIAYRVRVAGGRRKVQFARRAVHAVYRASGGTPRVINAVCDRALLIGYTQEMRDITARLVRRAAKEVRGERTRSARPSLLRRYVPSPAMLGVMVIIVLAGIFLVRPLADRPVVVAPPAPTETVSVAAVPESSPGTVEAMVKPPEEQLEAQKVVVPERVPDPLIGLLDELSPTVSRNAAAIGILQEWDMALLGGYPGSDTAESLEAFGFENGLSAMSASLSLDHLTAIDLPAFVKVAGDRQALWVGLLALQEDQARITTLVGSQVTVPYGSLKARYLKQAVIFWQDFAPADSILRAPIRGEDVRILQVQLRALGLLDTEPTGEYDEATGEAVRTLQERCGLEADGIAGKQTRMVLSSWLPGFASPPLREKVAEEDAGEVEVATEVEAASLSEQEPTSTTPAMSSITPKPANEEPKAEHATEAAEEAATPEPAAPAPNEEATDPEGASSVEVDVTAPEGENTGEREGESGDEKPAAPPEETDAPEDSAPSGDPENEDEVSPEADENARTAPRVGREDLAAPNPYVSAWQIPQRGGKAVTDSASIGSPLVPRRDSSPAADAVGGQDTAEEGPASLDRAV